MKFILYKIFSVSFLFSITLIYPPTSFALESNTENNTESKVSNEKQRSDPSELGVERLNQAWLKWIKLPRITGTSKDGRSVDFSHKQGQVNVVFFIATWCIPCQNFIEKFKELEKMYEDLGVGFYYIFNHDLMNDVKGFASSHELEDAQIILADNDTLFRYKDPPLPAIFIADKKGWIIERIIATKEDPLSKNQIARSLDYLIIR